MRTSQGKTKGRPKKSVLDRLNDMLDINVDLNTLVGVADNVPVQLREAHWYLKNQKPKSHTKFGIRKQAFGQQSFGVKSDATVRVRDNDGSLKSAARILHRELFGYEYPYTLRRSHGCNLNCVNPYHMAKPSSEVEIVPEEVNEVDKEFEELVSAIADFIGENGRDEEAVLSTFGLDYSEFEIKQALARVA